MFGWHLLDSSMRMHYPSSFLKLLLIGFAFAIFPLLLAFANANIAFDKLAKQSQITIANAVASTRASHVLQEQLHLMERSIRQYFVLQDTALLNNYKIANVKLNASIMQLAQLAGQPSSIQDPIQQQKIKQFQQQAVQLNLLVLNAVKTENSPLYFLNQFNNLTQQAEAIIQENNRVIDQVSSQLTHTAQTTQKNLLLQSLVLIPLALLVAGGITYMLARPIHRMDAAIKYLGKEQYEVPIVIDGPGDLRVLGQRLDWLRLELKDLNQQKQQFLQHVSHELKTPLTAIREATELLHDGIGGTLSAQQTEITFILRDNSLKLQKMIENLLNFTKLASIQSTLHMQRLHLPGVINKVLDAHHLTIRSKQLIVETNFSSDEIMADEEKLTIILDNLISNAVKYTPPHGTMKLITSQEKNGYVIEVSDNGPGLSASDQAKLFNPFYRGDSSYNSVLSGSGLGLAIAKDLVMAHGGSISVVTPTQSVPHQGAHFIVTIPKLESA